MKQTIDGVLQESGFRDNPYFQCLGRGDFSKEDFVETQIQFFSAVTFFSRPMAALAAKIPSPELRVEILRNVWEEHGEGDVSRFHATTFQEFLARLGNVSAEDIRGRTLWPEVRNFNTVLAGACVLDEYLVGAAMLGMIERMFCEISGWIGQSVVERGWIEKERLLHYNVHEKLDVKHAEDFFEILRPSWNQSAEDRYAIEQGLRAGAQAFDVLYRELYRNRSRRWMREVTGPHSRV